MSRFVNRFTVIIFALLGMVAVSLVLSTDFSDNWERVQEAAPDLPAEEFGRWWQPAWEWVQQNYLIAIGVVLVLLLPATRQLLVSTTVFVLPWVIGILLLYFVITNENWHAVVYNGVDSVFDWIFSPLLPENYNHNYDR